MISDNNKLWIKCKRGTVITINQNRHDYNYIIIIIIRCDCAINIFHVMSCLLHLVRRGCGQGRGGGVVRGGEGKDSILLFS